MIRHTIETVLGALTLGVAIWFFGFGLQYAGSSSDNGYKISGLFLNAEGLREGSSVRVSGVEVGKVSAMSLDPKTLKANIEMKISGDVKLSYDTQAVISQEGLLGGKFVRLSPGSDDEVLATGDVLDFTDTTPEIMDVLGQVIYSITRDKD